MLISRSHLAGPAAKAAVLLAVGALALTGCSTSGGTTTTDSGVKLIESGKLTVCSDIPYEPFEFVKDGKNVGFDMDLAAEIAKDLKVEPNVLTVAFEGIQSGQALNTNQCDIAVSGISITDARKTVMDFSTPYLDDDLSLLATKASGLKNLADLKGKKVGVQQGTTGDEYAKSKGLETIQYENTGLLLPGDQDRRRRRGHQQPVRTGLRGQGRRQPGLRRDLQDRRTARRRGQEGQQGHDRLRQQDAQAPGRRRHHDQAQDHLVRRSRQVTRPDRPHSRGGSGSVVGSGRFLTRNRPATCKRQITWL